MATETEVYVRNRLESEGWTVYRGGWPDFLCCKRINGKWHYKAVEVKSSGDDLRPNQQDILLSFADLGIPTFVMHQKVANVFYIEDISLWRGKHEQDFDGLGVS